MQKVIAIDGPSGSGKSTMAKQLAQALKLLYIDTGSMYRALGHRCRELNIPFTEGTELSSFLEKVSFSYGESQECLIRVDGENLTQKIREHEISKLASIISQLPSVRAYLVKLQRNLTSERVCVMEGRDIGTVVFPDAFCKIFVTASVEVRSQRRFNQLKDLGKSSVTLEQVSKDVIKRDDLDINREIAPLKQAEDGILLDTSAMEHEAVLKTMIEIVKEQARAKGISL